MYIHIYTKNESDAKMEDKTAMAKVLHESYITHYTRRQKKPVFFTKADFINTGLKILKVRRYNQRSVYLRINQLQVFRRILEEDKPLHQYDKWLPGNIRKLLEAMKNEYNYSLASIRSYISFIKIILPNYYQQLTELETKLNAKVKKAKAAEPLKIKLNTFEELRKTAVNYKSFINQISAQRKPRIFAESLVMAYILLTQPRRLLDWKNMKVVRDMKERNEAKSSGVNYVDIPKMEFVFKKYKTVKFYGTQHIKIATTGLREIIKHYVKHFSPDTLFSTVDIAGRIKTANQIFGLSGYTVNDWRHVFITYMFKKHAGKNERKKIAETIGNDVQTCIEVYEASTGEVSSKLFEIEE